MSDLKLGNNKDNLFFVLEKQCVTTNEDCSSKWYSFVKISRYLQC